MNYIANSKNRKLKNKIHTLFHRFSFNFLHLSMGRKVIGVGVLISFFSLFTRWFSIPDSLYQNNAFSLQVGYVGYVIFLLLVMVIFLLLSDRGSEKLKTAIAKTHITFSDHSVILFAGATVFLLTFVSFNSMRGLVLLYQQFTIGDGIIFELIGSIFMILGGLGYYREKRQDIIRMIYIENSQTNGSILDEYDDILKKNDQNKKNMSLPV